MDRTPLEVAMGHLRHDAKAGVSKGPRIRDDIDLSLEEMIAAILEEPADDGAHKLSQTNASLGSTLTGGMDNDLLQGGEGNDLITGNGGDDQLFGHGGDDSLLGGLGNDKLYGGAGADLLDGGDGGLDTASYYGAAAGVGVYLWNITRNTGDAARDSYVSIEVIDGSTYDDTIEGSTGSDAFWGDAGHDLLKGGVGADSLSGGAGNDHLFGGEGADHLDGGAGFDIASYADATSGVLVDLLDRSRNVGDALGDVHASIEGLIGSSYSDILGGTHEGDELYGGNGNDTLEGRGGSDVLDGGEGIDYASYESATYGVLVDLINTGRNTGDAVGDKYISIEKVIGSSHNDTIFGALGTEYLYGGDGDDVLEGGKGGDLLYGGTGSSDMASYSYASSGVTANLAAGGGFVGDANGDLYFGIEGLKGSDYADTLYGDADHNSLYGGGGNDYLQGGVGNDHLDGGDGFDVASYAAATSGVAVDLLDRSRNRGEAAGDIHVSIEGLIGSSYDDQLRGANGSESLSGGAGDDWLEGRGGGDRLDGGEGLDYASYDNSSSGVVVDMLNTGFNTGDAVGDTYVSIEGVIGSSHSDNLSGTAGVDSLFGGAGDDVLQGCQGGDLLDGGEGFDFVSYWNASSGVYASLVAGQGYAGDASGDLLIRIEGLQGSNYGDRLYGGDDGNTLYGWGGNDQLFGVAGNDYIEGGSGDDVISGGLGLDWLLGNAGADEFRMNTSPSAGGDDVDMLADFNGAEGDKISINTKRFLGYDADGNVIQAFPTAPPGAYYGLAYFEFGVGTQATTLAQRIVYDQATGSIYFDADGLASLNSQILFAKVAAGTVLTEANFQLYTL